MFQAVLDHLVNAGAGDGSARNPVHIILTLYRFARFHDGNALERTFLKQLFAGKLRVKRRKCDFGA